MIFLDQNAWATSGAGPVRLLDTTVNPEAKSLETTGSTAIFSPVVSAEEQEWSILIKSERKRMARKRGAARDVRKAVRAVRYGK